MKEVIRVLECESMWKYAESSNASRILYEMLVVVVFVLCLLLYLLKKIYTINLTVVWFWLICLCSCCVTCRQYSHLPLYNVYILCVICIFFYFGSLSQPFFSSVFRIFTFVYIWQINLSVFLLLLFNFSFCFRVYYFFLFLSFFCLFVCLLETGFVFCPSIWPIFIRLVASISSVYLSVSSFFSSHFCFLSSFYCASTKR